MDRDAVLEAEGSYLADQRGSVGDHQIADSMQGPELNLFYLLTATKRMDSLITASAIAAASMASFLLDLM